jgi:hypothetical protein
MKIAITGHTSGIGQALVDVYDLLGLSKKHTFRFYSRSNGWDIEEEGGDKVIQDIIDFDPDVVYNNAWRPGMQNRILYTLHEHWKDQRKLIVNTGSVIGYVDKLLGHGPEGYVKDKKELSEYCIAKSFEYPYKNKCMAQCFSFGFTKTNMTTDAGVERIDALQAAVLMIDQVDEAFNETNTYFIPEMVVNGFYSSKKDLWKTFIAAARKLQDELKG